MIVRDQISRAVSFNLPIGPSTKTPVALSVLVLLSVLVFVSANQSVNRQRLSL